MCLRFEPFAFCHNSVKAGVKRRVHANNGRVLHRDDPNTVTIGKVDQFAHQRFLRNDNRSSKTLAMVLVRRSLRKAAGSRLRSKQEGQFLGRRTQSGQKPGLHVLRGNSLGVGTGIESSHDCAR